MLIFYILQTIIPLVLIAWIAVAPQRSVLGFWTQAASSGLGLIALALGGILLVPPYWGPWVFGVLLFAALVTALRRRPMLTAGPRGVAAWIVLIGFSAFALFAADQTRSAYQGGQLPAGAWVDLSSPLGTGRFLVVNGGATTVVNAHADALDQSIPAHKPYFGTGYGIDFVAVDRFGLRASGVMPADPRRYRIFGTPVIAPCAGTIIVAVDGLPDMRVPELDDRLAGNHVILRCGQVDILLAHFRRGSVRVRVGAQVAAGTPIAEVGNSGSTSEPHLHIHAQRKGTAAAPFSGQPVPITIAGRFLVRNAWFDGAAR